MSFQKNATFKNLTQSLSTEMEAQFPSYKQIKLIGQGSFGKAYLVESEHDKKHYVLKKIRIDSQTQQAKQAIFKEINLLKESNHIYIIKYIESFVSGKNVCLIMEYAQNGDLQKYLEKRKQENNPLSEDQIISWFLQLCMGLKYLHDKKVIHRDLKTDNIFITANNQLKIGDFGVAKIMNQTFDLAKTKIGTPNIMAPEIFENKKYNQKTDIWSLGCVLYKLQMLKYPFQSTNIMAMMAKMQKKKFELIQGPYSQQLKQLTYELLSFEPQLRPSVHKILQIPFLKRNLPHILQNSIRIYNKTNSSLTESKKLNDSYQKKLNDSNGTPSLPKSNKKSISLFTNSILTPLSKKNDNISGIFQNNSTSKSHLIACKQNYHSQKSANIKMIEFKQNYPISLQQNRQLKEENGRLKLQKQTFQQQSTNLFEKLEQNLQNLSKEEIVQQMKHLLQNYLYK